MEDFVFISILIIEIEMKVVNENVCHSTLRLGTFLQSRRWKIMFGLVMFLLKASTYVINHKWHFWCKNSNETFLAIFSNTARRGTLGKLTSCWNWQNASSCLFSVKLRCKRDLFICKVTYCLLSTLEMTILLQKLPWRY